ncbi:MAG: hypothetical protein NTW78_01120 [Campylobacterales bacterium]|nr:hypothetical protein [Campylobacterales bacterium]
MLKIIVILALVLSLYAEEEYQLGEGIQVASLPFFVGGYVSSDYRNMNNENRYRLDDIAVIGYGSYDKFSYMAEVEYKGFYTETYKDDAKDVNKNNRLNTERIYLDYNYNESYMFRVGKYNSPIGFWNLLPVNVLRDTSSNPITSEIIFPKFTTGAGATYSSYNEAELKVNLMLQNNEDIDNNYNNYKIDKHYGIGLLYGKDDYAIKINGGHFNRLDSSLATPDELYYFLLSGKYDRDKYQFQSEIGSQKSKREFTTNYAAYIQGLYRFTEQHIGILRFESYDDKLNNKKDDIAIVAHTYRPIYPVAIKSEYQFHSLHLENQFLFSLSVMF